MIAKFDYVYKFIMQPKGADEEFFCIGSFWEYDSKTIHSFYGFSIAAGHTIYEQESYDEIPFQEPFETEIIIVRPVLKYPKRRRVK